MGSLEVSFHLARGEVRRVKILYYVKEMQDSRRCTAINCVTRVTVRQENDKQYSLSSVVLLSIQRVQFQSPHYLAPPMINLHPNMAAGTTGAPALTRF